MYDLKAEYPGEEPEEEPIDVSYNRVVSIVKSVLGKAEGRASEPPRDWQAAAKVLAHYVKDGDTIRMRLEDVQSLVRHVLHLRAQVRELQAIGTDLIEENRALRSEASPKEERGET
jgi:hypothetical protein